MIHGDNISNTYNKTMFMICVYEQMRKNDGMQKQIMPIEYYIQRKTKNVRTKYLVVPPGVVL